MSVFQFLSTRYQRVLTGRKYCFCNGVSSAQPRSGHKRVLALFAIAIQSRGPAFQGAGMNHPNRPRSWTASVLVLSALGTSACTTSGPQLDQPAAPAAVQAGPPAFPPQNIVGRWGLAAYHKEEDRARTEAAARGQCKQPYVITLGPSGGVMMHLADQA